MGRGSYNGAGTVYNIWTPNTPARAIRAVSEINSNYQHGVITYARYQELCSQILQKYPAHSDSLKRAMIFYNLLKSTPKEEKLSIGLRKKKGRNKVFAGRKNRTTANTVLLDKEDNSDNQSPAEPSEICASSMNHALTIKPRSGKSFTVKVSYKSKAVGSQ